MKITGSRADSFTRHPDPKVQAVLIYGPDTGLVKERADCLSHTVVDDLNDPFRVVELSGQDLKKDPARLSDEVCAQSFLGGRRLLRIRDAGDALSRVLQDWLDSGLEGALVVAEGGELGPRSSLRKLFEKEDRTAAIACFADDAKSLAGVIRQSLSDQGIQISRDALTFLVGSLGSDRGVTRKELEKLVLYADGSTKIELEDVEHCIGDSGAASLDAVVYAVAGGDQAVLDRALHRLFGEGQHAVTILRVVSRHFQRLHLARGLADGGLGTEGAMKKLRPPVMFKFTDAFRRQLDQWTQERLASALAILS